MPSITRLLLAGLGALSVAAAGSSDLANVNNILDYVYPDPSDRPKTCAPIPGGSVINRCENGTRPILEIQSLTIDPYPLEPGHTNFNMVYRLRKDIPQGSTLKLTSFSDEKGIFDGELDLCQYFMFGNIFCPVDVTPPDEMKEMKQVLEVPDDAPEGIYSFLATAYTPEGEEIIQLAANIDLRNPKLTHHDDL